MSGISTCSDNQSSISLTGINGWIPCGTTINVTCSVCASEPPQGKLELKTNLKNPMVPDDEQIQNFDSGAFCLTIIKKIEYV